jgi:Mg/Co/Ni transporter MgtE
MHDGYASGVALPQQVLAINEREAPFVPIGVLAQPISRVNAVRENDALLEAFTKMRRLRADWVPVLSSQENLIGIVTMDDILQQVEGNRPDLQETGQHDSDRVPVAA